MLFSGKGRQVSNPSRGPVRIAVLSGVVGAAVAVPMATATGAQAASVGNWDKVAQCESSGNWQANTGNGHYGGLQFSNSSWDAAGGTKYAPRADQASKGQQIATAERLLKMQGPGAWQCAGAGNLTAGGPSPDVQAGGGSQQQGQPQDRGQDRADRSADRGQPESAPQSQPKSTSQPKPHKNGHGNYTVRHGDTLASIATAHNEKWQQIYQDNKSVIGKDADLILPGQKLQVG